MSCRVWIFWTILIVAVVIALTISYWILPNILFVISRKSPSRYLGVYFSTTKMIIVSS